jgi:hypothetical protein
MVYGQVRCWMDDLRLGISGSVCDVELGAIEMEVRIAN